MYLDIPLPFEFSSSKSSSKQIILRITIALVLHLDFISHLITILDLIYHLVKPRVLYAE